MYHCDISIHIRCSRSHKQCYIWYVSLQDQYTFKMRQESLTVLCMVFIIATSEYTLDTVGVTSSVIYGMYHCKISTHLRCKRSH